MPLYVINKTAEALNSVKKPIRGSKVGVLGMAYKKDIDDHRESPSFKLIELLLDRGAEVSYCDPHVPKLPEMRHYDLPAMTTEQPTPEYFSSLDCTLVSTDHTLFDWDEVVRHSSLVVDTRNATSSVSQGREKIFKA